MKNNLRLIVLSVILIFAISLSSCNLPINNAAKVQTTPPSPVLVTPSPNVLQQLSADSMEATPTPEKPLNLADVVPVTGSILTWIDFSNFVYVPAGEFNMGKESLTPVDNSPAHKVNLAGFWIHQAEVTNQQYAACVEVGVCSAPHEENGYPYWYSHTEKANSPVVGVSWDQAQQYCDYIEARLPTEAEWEKTARGTKDDLYPWGKDQPSCSLLNFNSCHKTPQPDEVRSYMSGASDYEALDLAGNVFEWTNDWYDEKYYTSSSITNPLGPETGLFKVYRGGGYLSDEQDVATTSRFFTEPVQHSADLGFRCVLKGTYSDSNSNSQVPRPCEVLPVSQEQPETQPTWTPFPCDSPYIAGNCYLTSSGGPITSIYIQQSNCQSNNLKDFSSTKILNLNCIGPNLVGNSKTYTCNGMNMIQGSSVDLSFCHKFYYQLMSPKCPSGYIYDSSSEFCFPSTGPWLPEPPCPIGYVEEDGQCLPDVGVYQGCPVGFYYFLEITGPTTVKELCLPLNDCLLPNATEPCDQPVCPSGQTYVSANNCCSLPTKLRAVCPVGFGVQEDPVTNQLFCDLPDLFPPECETRQVKIAYCPTRTPSPTPTFIPPSKNCSDFKDSSSCILNGCAWGPSGAFCH